MASGKLTPMFVEPSRWRALEMIIHVGDHVVVRGDNEEAIVTAVHPNWEVEIKFLHAADAGERRKRYAAEALDIVESGHPDHRRR